MEDENEADDNDAVMVDALEALRLAQPHIDQAGYVRAQSYDENQRPHTASGSRHESHGSSSLTNGMCYTETRGHSPAKGSCHPMRKGSSRLTPLGDGLFWSNNDTIGIECNGTVHEPFGNNSTSVQSGLQSRLAEAAEDLHDDVAYQNQRQESDEINFNSSQYWKTPIAMPDDIDNA